MSKEAKRSSFRGRVSEDARRQQKAATSYGYLNLPRDVRMFAPEPGSRNILLDFMPYIVTDPKHPDANPKTGAALVGTPWFKHPIWVHRNIGGDSESVICLKTVGKHCPICEYRAKLIKDETDKETTDALKPSHRNLYIVIPIGHKSYAEEPHIFDISQYLFQNLLNEELEENDEYEVFPDLAEGYTLKIRFSSETIGTSKPFAEAKKIEFVEREGQYPEDTIDKMPNLDEIIKVLSYDELKDKLFDLDDEEDGGHLKEAIGKERITRQPKDKDDDEPTSNEEDDERPSRIQRIKKTTASTKEPVVHRTEPKEESVVTREKQIEKAPTETKDVVKDRCPSGYRFGVDTSKYDECDTCEIWDACSDEKRKNKK
jgi:hypothetical protein